ncbi:MAG: glutathione S-transferase family protein [Gammaproteobacteria bacterium]|jgi:glutathione S-transferase|nr:glutathione S-transferase family protein [Gammaproteobacteria bacterium]MBT3858525.1 glutathione S-transferase family protein [Gammaproteobacteria bacterium]MBT3986737.1 glutathione S-transferase family protein [Gammaproteobacteria bacterium]MBT4255649.1 glutathione S-transferase family protein [Gammaproteobacteria bacterium]MBT4582833.1 glutathione S-transferase family protein [Gammaproteobacteria bacterium]
MKLYHCKGARSLRPLWALEEMGLEYELVTMEFPPRFNHEGYLDINPLGTVPTFIDGDVTMTESSGICQYLVDKHGPHLIGLDPGHLEYGDYLNWLHRSDATLTFPLAIVLRYSELEPEERRIPQAVEDYSIWFMARLRSVEAALEGKEFLVANRFTIADIAVGYALFMGARLGLDERYKPNCKRYLESLMAREAFKRANSEA